MSGFSVRRLVLLGASGIGFYTLAFMVASFAVGGLSWASAQQLRGQEIGVQAAAPGLPTPRSIAINGVQVHPVIETKILPSGREGLPVWFLPQLGVQTRNSPGDLRLSYGARSLRYTGGRWMGGVQGSELGLQGSLKPPEPYGLTGSLHVGLDVLRALGVPLSVQGEGQGQGLNVLNVTVLNVPASLPTSHVPVRQAPPVTSTTQSAAPPKPAPSKPTPSKPTPSKPTPSKPTPSKPAAPPPKTATQWAGVRPIPATSSPSSFGVVPYGAVPYGGVPAAPPIAHTAPATYTAPAAHTAPAARPTVAPVPNVSAVPSVPALPAAGVPRPTPVPSGTPPATSTVSPMVSPEVPLIGPRVLGIRSSASTQRSVQLQRVVIDLTGPVTYSAAGPLSYFLLGASAQAGPQPVTQTLDSGDTVTLSASTNAAGRPGTLLRLQSHHSLSVQGVQILENPPRLVIDTAALVGDAPPPINPDALPTGVSLRQMGAITLLSFDPARFAARVVAAPTGSALSVAELVRRVGGVAGVNGGYFDPPSSLSVDFVGVGGQMLSGSLEKRAAVGFDAQGHVQFGYPRPRYFVSVPLSTETLMVNAVTPRPLAGQLSAFVGDGRTATGSSNLTTLLLSADKGAGRRQVIRAVTGRVVVPAGLLSLSFDPQRFPKLPTGAGASLSVTLDYQLQSWAGVHEGLAAGPLLLAGGRVVIDPVREAFNVYTGIWRPTRQVGFALYQGQPTIAFMDFGTPESFASALQKAGVSDAMRLDSGSSATVYVTGGYLGTGGYLNTVWSRPVPNALVLVPR